MTDSDSGGRLLGGAAVEQGLARWVRGEDALGGGPVRSTGLVEMSVACVRTEQSCGGSRNGGRLGSEG